MSRSLLLSPRWRKVWADLAGNKLRTLLVVLSITVGVFAVGMVYSSYLMFQRDLAGSWGAASPADVSLYADPFDEELIDSIRSLRGVREADGRFNADVRVRTAGGEWRQMWLTAIPDYIKQKVNVVRPESGSWPPGDGDVLLERSSVTQLGMVEGSRILVETAAGNKRLLKITGIVYDSSQLPSLFSGRAYGYIDMDTLEKLDEERRLNQVNLVVEPWVLQGKEKAPIEAVGRRAFSKLEQGNTTVTWFLVNKPGEHLMHGPISAILLLLAVMGVLSLLLSTFLLVNTVAAILTQQVRQLGIMKAIGAQRNQLLRMYLTLVGAYGILALVVAAPLGALAASALTGFMAGMFNFDSGGLEFPGRVLLLETAVALGGPLAAALWPVWQGTGRTVREAISDYGIGGVVPGGRFDRCLDAGLAKLKELPRPVVLSLRNTFRQRGRLVLTLLTLTMAGTAFMAVFSLRAALYAGLEQTLDYYRYDVMVQFTESYRTNRIDQAVMRVPGVKAAEVWGYTPGRILRDERKESENAASSEVTVLAPPVDTEIIRPVIRSGRWLVPGDENALVVDTTTVNDNPQLTVGAPAVVKIGDHKLRLTVVGIAQGVLEGTYVYAPYGWLSGAIQEAGRARSVQIVATDSAPQAQKTLGRAVDEHLKRQGLKVKRVTPVFETKQRIQQRNGILIAFLLIMVVLLAVVGALGLAGSLGLNVLERTREIGVMRAIGASSLDIARVFVLEALCIGLISWLAGALLAVPMAALLAHQVGLLFFHYPLDFYFSFTGVGIWLGVSVTLSLLASLLPAWNAARMSVREVLNYE
ncbi:ABC transporter permease [Sporomusa termitida]|uniref:ADOP: acidobacterial duplicated orphan permease n=1 Tax=Sporomusa termitida TaxID=2377 RepID=A0A517DRB4_9FIRM|nr:FtsX-like permease family protein [Sporomusa termitida]QDR79895.1 ADOP: acidobacterial duplicated orphan permease [Sporomusa termitida]